VTDAVQPCLSVFAKENGYPSPEAVRGKVRQWEDIKPMTSWEAKRSNVLAYLPRIYAKNVTDKRETRAIELSFARVAKTPLWVAREFETER
jgi:hypothetical protein